MRGGSGERIDLASTVDTLTRIVRRRRGFPRPRLIWRFEGYGARRDRYGPARIDTIDEHCTVIATEPLADRITPYHATMLALERCLDSDIDGELHLAT